MAIREILRKGDETLNKKSRLVEKFDEKLWRLLDDMKETMESANGVGLAAPQIGILRKVVIVCVDGENLYEMINPEIISAKGEQEEVEGCLSVPGVYGIVKRPMVVRVRAQDRNGKEYEVEGEEFLARAFCHETDHLNGNLFTELVSEFVDIEDVNRDD